jgi:hypothetical protein
MKVVPIPADAYPEDEIAASQPLSQIAVFFALVAGPTLALNKD